MLKNIAKYAIIYKSVYEGKMFYVTLDTNLIRKQSNQIKNIMDFGFSNRVETELPCFIRQLSKILKIGIAIPEVCIEEYVKQRAEDYCDCVKKYNDSALRLNSAYPITMPNFLSEENYALQLRSDAIEYCKKNNITIIGCMDFVNWNNMFRNSIERKLPFVKDGNSPFKDAMIYESCLGFAKRHTHDQVVLLTYNTADFKKLDDIHKQSNLKIIAISEGDSRIEAVINSAKSFGIEIGMDFAISAAVFVDSDDIQFKIKEAFQSQILAMEYFSSPLIVQDSDGNYEYSYNIDEDSEQVEIVANIIDGDREDLYPFRLFFNRDNGGYLFRQFNIVVENEQGEELLNA